MESASIVSFNNDSTYQTTLKADYENLSVHELALHAMRDRCLLLQRRINTLESDNMRLKLDVTKSSDKSSYAPLTEDEKQILYQRIADLSKQKSQLLHHVFMVSCENKNLWSKISCLKGTDKNIRESNKPIVRTNTYIHSTPNANVREKYCDSSLEEISLKLIDSYILEKSQLIDQYEHLTQLQDADEDILNVDSIGFVYMEDPITDSLKDIQSQTEKLIGIKKDLAEQEDKLRIILSRMEKIVTDGYKCSTCMNSTPKTILYENKETETSGSLMWDVNEGLSTYTDNSIANIKDISEVQDNQKRNYLCNKMCPICGKTFLKESAFSDFQSHVENHFIGETDIDSLDNFENSNNSME